MIIDLLGLNIGRPDHLRPLLGIFDSEFTEFVRRDCKRLASQMNEPLSKTGIAERSIYFPIQFSITVGAPLAREACAIST